MSEPMLDGVLDVVDTEESALHSTTPTPKPEKVETKTETPKETKTETNTKTETKTPDVETEEDDDKVEDTQDFSRLSPDETETDTETTAPSKTETQTEAETPSSDEPDLQLPPAPVFSLAPPEVNQFGEITNMTPAQYEQYIVEKAKYEMRAEAYIQTSENKALDAAEKILPELKTSQAVRKLVENTRQASILSGQQINSYEAAKLVKEALGLSSTKIAEAKAAGAQNAKASITIQKNAAVETTGSTKKKSEPSVADKNLTKRLKQGDDEAFAELFDNWDKAGKLS